MTLNGDKITIHSLIEGACSSSESLAGQWFQKNSSAFFLIGIYALEMRTRICSYLTFFDNAQKRKRTTNPRFTVRLSELKIFE